jgi:hypothetical protein
MQSKYCECGHRVLGNTCSRCARRHRLVLEIKSPPTASKRAPDATLTKLRALKSLLEQARITETEYEEQRNHVLATF